MNKIKLIRAVEAGYSSNNKLCVISIGYLYPVNIETLLKGLVSDQRVLGVEINNKFHICYDIEINAGEKVFGYALSKKDQDFSFQIIDSFDLSLFNYHEGDYNLGKIIELHISEVTEFFAVDYQVFKI